MIIAFSTVGGLVVLACIIAFLRNRGYLLQIGIRPADPVARELDGLLHHHPWDRPLPILRSRFLGEEEGWDEVLGPELKEVELTREGKGKGGGMED